VSSESSSDENVDFEGIDPEFWNPVQAPPSSDGVVFEETPVPVREPHDPNPKKLKLRVNEVLAKHSMDYGTLIRQVRPDLFTHIHVSSDGRVEENQLAADNSRYALFYDSPTTTTTFNTTNLANMTHVNPRIVNLVSESESNTSDESSTTTTTTSNSSTSTTTTDNDESPDGSLGATFNTVNATMNDTGDDITFMNGTAVNSLMVAEDTSFLSNDATANTSLNATTATVNETFFTGESTIATTNPVHTYVKYEDKVGVHSVRKLPLPDRSMTRKNYIGRMTSKIKLR
jgi:hypothetical protein